MRRCHARLRGLFNITVTPFTADGAFDHAGLARNIERVIGLGFDGILIGGTYGEFPAMSGEERAGLFRRVMDIVGDRVPVMLCSANSDVRVVRELTTLAGDLGGLPMVTPPFVSEVTDAQIVAFFRDMVPLSRTGVLVYNAPGIGITPVAVDAGATRRLFPASSASSRVICLRRRSIRSPTGSAGGSVCSAPPTSPSSVR